MKLSHGYKTLRHIKCFFSQPALFSCTKKLRKAKQFIDERQHPAYYRPMTMAKIPVSVGLEKTTGGLQKKFES